MIAVGFAANHLNFQRVSGGWMLISCLVWLEFQALFLNSGKGRHQIFAMMSLEI